MICAEGRSMALSLFGRTGFKAGLKAIADTRLGNEKARVIGIGFDFLPQLANENSQVLDIISLVTAPNLPEQLVVRHHEADMRRQNMEQAIFFLSQSDLALVE